MPEQIAEVQTDSAAPVITDELLRDIDQNPEKIQSLDRKTRRAVLEKVRAQADGSADGADKSGEPEKKETVEPPEKKAEVTAEKKDETKEADTAALSELEQKREASREEAKRLADEVNRYEQKIEARKKLKQKLEDEWKEFEKQGVKKPADFFDDTHQTGVYEELQKTKKQVELLNQRISARETEELQEIESTLKSKAEDKVFGEFETLQSQYEELRTKKPLRVLNQEYAVWLDALVAEQGLKEKSPNLDIATLRQTAVERYHSDPEFQKVTKAKPPEELDKLSLILQLNDRKQKTGGSVRGHWLEMLDEQGIIADVVQRGRTQAAKDAAQKTMAALKRGTEEITTISPSEGTAKAGYTETGMTEGQAVAFLKLVNDKQAAGGRLTADERVQLHKVRVFLMGST